jgi:hypothetical protein
VLRLEPRPSGQTRDASGWSLLGHRFYGCLVPQLYNTVRPHSSLGYRPPAPGAWLGRLVAEVDLCRVLNKIELGLRGHASKPKVNAPVANLAR